MTRRQPCPGYDQAIAEGDRALALDPNNADSYTLQAQALLFAGRPEKALRMMRPALAETERAGALAPTEAWSSAALAEVLSRVGKTEDALEAAAQALRLKPTTADSHLAGIGTAYAVAGRYEEARAEAAEVLRLNP